MFARKTRSGFFGSIGDEKPLSTFDAWVRFAGHSSVAAATWMAQLAKIPDAKVGELVAMVPNHRMTDVCKEFTLQLLIENRRRLLEDAVS